MLYFEVLTCNPVYGTDAPLIKMLNEVERGSGGVIVLSICIFTYNEGTVGYQYHHC